MRSAILTLARPALARVFVIRLTLVPLALVIAQPAVAQPASVHTLSTPPRPSSSRATRRVLPVGDAPAPSLESRLDRPLEPWIGRALSVDAVGIVFGAYDLRLDLGLTRFVGVGLSPGWLRREELHGPSFGLTLELWPLGRGLDGLALGVEAEVAWLPASRDRGLFSVTGQAAYRHVWRGVVAGVGVGVRHERGLGAASQDLARRLSPQVSVWLGWGLESG